MRNVDKAIEWMEKQSKNPSQSWKGLCQSTCRQAYSMGPFGSSARDAWGNVKDRYKVKITKYNDKEWWQSASWCYSLLCAPKLKVWSRLVSKWRHDWMVCRLQA